jgi:ribonuclease HI
VAEIKAAIRACELLRNYGTQQLRFFFLDFVFTIINRAGVQRIVIFTDSQYLIDSITDWIFTWQSNGWRTFQGQPVVHKALYQELLYLTRDFDCVEWVSYLVLESQ